MKRTSLVVLAIALFLAGVAAHYVLAEAATERPGTAAVGRYTIIPVAGKNGVNGEQGAYVLDTATGESWHVGWVFTDFQTGAGKYRASPVVKEVPKPN